MEINTTIPPTLPHSTATNRESALPADERRPGAPEEVPAPRERRAEAEQLPGDKPKVPIRPRFHLELSIDEGTNQVFGRIVDAETGREVRQIPAKELRQMSAKIREMLGRLVDETA